MIKLAASSGTVIYENENKLYLVRHPAQWTATFLFVTGLLAFIFLANYFLRFFVAVKSHLSPTPSIIFLGLGILFALIFWMIIAYRKRLNAKPVSELKCICIIDLTSNNLLDGEENLLAPLREVQLIRKMQFTSSSPELVLKWNKNTLTLLQGNPFSGGITAVENILISKGIKRN